MLTTFFFGYDPSKTRAMANIPAKGLNIVSTSKEPVFPRVELKQEPFP